MNLVALLLPDFFSCLPSLFISPSPCLYLSLSLSLPPHLSPCRCFVDVKVARFGHQPAYKRIVLKALLDCVAEEADEFRDGGQKVRAPPLTVLNQKLSFHNGRGNPSMPMFT